MFRFGRKKGAEGGEAPDADAETEDTGTAEAAPAVPEAAPVARTEEQSGSDTGSEAGSGGLLARLKTGLQRSRTNLAEGLGNLLLGEKEINETVLEDLETQLLMSDVGVDATSVVIERLTARVKRRQLNDTGALLDALGDELEELLVDNARPFEVPEDVRPFVILVVGVNGVGKTTTIGKLARRFKDAGLKPLLAAGDTFRAAAVEQLAAWGERNDVDVISQGDGADSASVIFDALGAARSRGVDVVIADTAGRLHNKAGLMDELAKIGRIMGRFDADAPHAVLLVLDAGTGQNALAQAREFGAAVDVSGIVLTKLDGTAKGGIIFALARQTGLPIQFIGIGEQVEDLRPFEPRAFVRALLDLEA